MHYYIDGYNLLFRLVPAAVDLRKERERIIRDLNKKVLLLNLDISIVFDSTFQEGERTRSHYQGLEILFTAEGETADDYIIDEIKNSPKPHLETVVTSDKKLASIVRRDAAHTESIETFLLWLNKAYQNKKKPAKSVAKSERPAPKKKPPEPKKLTLPPPTTDPESCFDYYEKVFEAELKLLLAEESKVKAEKKSAKKPSKPPRKKISPRLAPTSESDMERWLKAFEQNS